MVHQKDFNIKIDYDDAGLLVVVMHKPTGIQRIARPSSRESVQEVKDRLFFEVRSEFFNEDEFTFEIGRCKVNGKVGDWYGVTHLPTGKSRTTNSIEHPVTHNVHYELLDEIVEELWNEGIRPK